MDYYEAKRAVRSRVPNADATEYRWLDSSIEPDGYQVKDGDRVLGDGKTLETAWASALKQISIQSGCRPDAITIWRFHDAPEAFRLLSTHGGDEDWLAFVPKVFEDEWIGWLESGSSFGCCSVSEHVIADGTVKIGAHS